MEARTTQDVKENGKVLLKKGYTPDRTRYTNAGSCQRTVTITTRTVFDHAVLKEGQEIPRIATIQALAVAQPPTTADTGADDLMASGSGTGAVSGVARGGGGLRGSVLHDGGYGGQCREYGELGSSPCGEI